MPRGRHQKRKSSPVDFVNEVERADILLVERAVFESRARAVAAIEAGGVTADGAIVASPSQRIRRDAALNARPAHPWVGRGALKLDHALSLWPVPVEGRVVLDVGASTGGFTQVCLARGARRVYAVDVGHGQLHPTVAADPRVVSLEATDARRLTPKLIPEAPELIVADISFISLTKALSAPLSLTAAFADLVALVKPQFELEKRDLRGGGLVESLERRREALEGVVAWLDRQGWPVESTADSPIIGGGGALEFLLWARRA